MALASNHGIVRLQYYMDLMEQKRLDFKKAREELGRSIEYWKLK